jgi:hypothetical protein
MIGAVVVSTVTITDSIIIIDRGVVACRDGKAGDYLLIDTDPQFWLHLNPPIIWVKNSSM